MQLVNTIDIPFVHQLSIGHKAHRLAAAFARVWDRLRVALPETAAFASPAARTPIGVPGYFGGAYDRLIASAPMVSCVECIGADPFPQAPASSRGTFVAKKTDLEPRPDGKEDTWRSVLLAHLESPALII